MQLFSKLFQKEVKKKSPVELAWEYSAPSTITSSPAISKDNSLIVFGTKDGVVIAVDDSGKNLWNYSVKKKLSDEELFFKAEENFQQISADPVIADLEDDSNERVIIASEVGLIVVLDEGGKPLWNYKAGDTIKSSPLLADINCDNKLEIIFGCNDKFLYALSSKGKLLWKFKAKSEIEGSPGFVGGQIIFGSNDGTIYSLDTRGKPLWEYKTKDTVIAKPSELFLSKDDIKVLIGSFDSNLYCFDTNGTLIWRYNTGSKIFSQVTVAKIDNRIEILLGSSDDKLHVISAKGNRVWNYETDFWVFARPIVFDINSDHKDEIIIGSYDNRIYIFDSESDYNLEYMPGISAITQQTGHYFETENKQSGDYHGKLLLKVKLNSMITGMVPIEKDKKGIIVTTNSKRIFKIIYNR